jgi:DNA modification methylase
MKTDDEKSNVPEFDPSNFNYVPIDSVKPNPRNARIHPKKQLREIAGSIKTNGFLNPILIDETGTVLCGHGRWAAAKLAGLKTVPVLRVEHLSDAQKRAYVLFDNKIAEKAGWDREILFVEFTELCALLPKCNLDITATAFEIGEVDMIIADRAKEPPPKAGEFDDERICEPPRLPVTRRGDMWIAGLNRILCGDARSAADIDRVMQGDKARMAFLDPPYNVKVHGHVQGRGAVQHEEFAFASGEMSASEFIAFLKDGLAQAVRVSLDGALHFVCMDWRHMEELLAAGKECYSGLLNVCVWAKTCPGLGSLYRSQHEMVFVHKVGEASHRNGVELGRHGRNRSNVWNYPGASPFKKNGREELSWHPTVKPVALVADAMRDCTIKGEIVLDTFLGSGSTLMAAERIGRLCRGVEYEPKYVDVAIQRWQAWTKRDAVCAATGATFDEIAAQRGGAAAAEEALGVLANETELAGGVK